MDQMTLSEIRKINEKTPSLERAGKRILHFEIGCSDFATPGYIKKAEYKTLGEGKLHYTSNFGIMELYQAIADDLGRKNDISYTVGEILATVGLSEVVFDVFASVLNEGEKILVLNPEWLNYINVPSLLGAKTSTCNLLKEGSGFQVHPEELRQKHRQN